KPTREDILEILQGVKDPEIPVISVVELGIVRDVVIKGEEIRVDITPTYSGCPANKVIENSIREALETRGFEQVEIRIVYSPPWTTDWIDEEARQKLKEYGIAPPGKPDDEDWSPFGNLKRVIPCPFCNSEDTTLTSEFGSTACKALYYCNTCRQPFEHFKCV
ncbi:MAG: 1,2-phenylacetyl-CoA epoxidase subunit PaaD, partial [Calditrichia bacterium]